MAGASDKARFYLEQSVPELQELLQKKIFTGQEITSIAKKRSDFEHKLNARGSKPVDYARYAEYEMNLESLRQKRVKRQGLKNSGHTGQRRIFFVLDRATKKFSGDLGLWMQYIEFARKQKANKKLSQIFTTVLRLHPTNPELWIYAANYALDVKFDLVEARSCMQRGLRFCKSSRQLWCEYAKLEMIYISRVEARRRRLEVQVSKEEDDITLPVTTDDTADIASLGSINKDVLEKLQETPTLSGAIPIAIFNAAMKEFNWDSDLGRQFFDLMGSFQEVPCVTRILRHIVQGLRDAAPLHTSTLSCFFREPTSCVEVTSPEFPGSLRDSLDRLKLSIQSLSNTSSPERSARLHSALACSTVDWTLDLLEHGNLDEEVTRVLLVVLKKTWNKLLMDLEVSPGIDSKVFSSLVEHVQRRDFETLTAAGVTVGLRIWPESARLSEIRRSAM